MAPFHQEPHPPSLAYTSVPPRPDPTKRRREGGKERTCLVSLLADDYHPSRKKRKGASRQQAGWGRVSSRGHARTRSPLLSLSRPKRTWDPIAQIKQVSNSSLVNEEGREEEGRKEGRGRNLSEYFALMRWASACRFSVLPHPSIPPIRPLVSLLSTLSL